MKKCVFAGTFDPPTAGHKKIIEDCLKLFDEVVVAIMANREKSPLFSESERELLLKKLFKGEPRVRVVISDGAAVDLLKAENTRFYVRGIRNTVDLEYENANLYANRRLMPDIVTVYLPAEQDCLHVSSTLVKNSIAFKKDFSAYVPEEIYADVIKLTESKNV